jgi:alpha-L-rhamnosidase
MLPDGSINPGEMTSFNHYALGAVANFMHATIGGISPLESGWKRIRIAPRPGGTVTSASVKHLSPYGEVSCRWKLVDDIMTANVSIPPNTTAEVSIGDFSATVGSGQYEYEVEYKVEGWPPKPIWHSMTEPLIDVVA